MTRWAAALAFVLAAFDVPVPFLDRAGIAACGFAFLALSVPARREGRAGTLDTMLGALERASENERVKV